MLMWQAEFEESDVLFISQIPTIVLPDVEECNPETHFLGSTTPAFALSRMVGADSE